MDSRSLVRGDKGKQRGEREGKIKRAVKTLPGGDRGERGSEDFEGSCRTREGTNPGKEQSGEGRMLLGERRDTTRQMQSLL